MLNICTNEEETRKYLENQRIHDKYYKDKPFYSSSTHIQATMLEIMKDNKEKPKMTMNQFILWLILYGIFIVVFIQACGT